MGWLAGGVISAVVTVATIRQLVLCAVVAAQTQIPSGPINVAHSRREQKVRPLLHQIPPTCQ